MEDIHEPVAFLRHLEDAVIQWDAPFLQNIDNSYPISIEETLDLEKYKTKHVSMKPLL